MPSSVIQHIIYHPDREDLIITYNSGIKYLYKAVPEMVYKHLKAAPSKGTFLNYHIKGKYAFERMDR